MPSVTCGWDCCTHWKDGNCENIDSINLKASTITDSDGNVLDILECDAFDGSIEIE